MTNVKRGTLENNPEKGIVVQNISIRPVNRQSQDIDKWRNAIRAAEAINGTRVPLYDLYNEILLDGVLENVVKKRVLGVTKTKLKFVNSNGEEVPEMTKLLKKKQFRKLRKEIQLQKTWGISVVELMNDEKGFRVYSVPRKHIRPKEGRITYEQHGVDGIDYRQPPADKFILEVGEWDDLGLLLKAAPYVIYKRGGFGDWAQFAEVFGMPFREARYDGFNDVVRKQLEMALDQAGSAAYAILPKEADFTLHPTPNTQGSGELYNNLRRACNEELSILFLGQTETTTKTAGKLGGNDDTHEQTEDDINEDDKADELAIFNEQVLPILANLGFPVQNGEFVHEKQEKEVPVKEKIDNVIKLKKDFGLPVDDDYVYEMSGVPKPSNYDQLKKEQLQQQQEPTPADKKKKRSSNDPGESTEEKLAWLDRFRLKLSDFFDQAPRS